MKERGMIFNAEMVRAILDGRKTQTRRVISNRHLHLIDIASQVGECHPLESDDVNSQGYYREHCPFGMVGDHLWVRETFAILGNEDGCAIDWNENLIKEGGKEAARIYRASCEQLPGNYGLWSIPDIADWKPHTWNVQYEGNWVPSIHMPRWASRITLEITDVRVERLNGISLEDAKAEGVKPAGKLLPDSPESFLTPGGDFATSQVAFQRLWESIYGEENWQANPWVWVIEFKRVEASDEQ